MEENKKNSAAGIFRIKFYQFRLAVAYMQYVKIYKITEI